MKKLLGQIYKVAYPLAHLYWFIFRPKTSGTKCIITKENKILLVKHSYIPSVWSVPGGGVKKSEMPEKAVIRVVFEETGINIKNPELLDTIVATHQHKIDTISIFTSETSSNFVSGRSAEISELQWFDRNNLPENTSWLVRSCLK